MESDSTYVLRLLKDGESKYTGMAFFYESFFDIIKRLCYQFILRIMTLSEQSLATDDLMR